MKFAFYYSKDRQIGIVAYYWILIRSPYHPDTAYFSVMTFNSPANNHGYRPWLAAVTAPMVGWRRGL